MVLIENDRTKLLSSVLNIAATSSFTIGVLAPMAAAFYNIGNAPVRISTLILGTGIWLCTAAALHLAARYVLRRLRDD